MSSSTYAVSLAERFAAYQICKMGHFCTEKKINSETTEPI
jgi:hypothetical protein